MFVLKAPGHVSFLFLSPLQMRNQRHRKIKSLERQDGQWGH